MRLFKSKVLALGVASGWISFMGGSAVIFMMSFYLQRVLGYSPREAGLIVIAGAFSMIVLGPLAGRLSDRYGWRKFNMAGLAVSATGLFLLSTNLTVDSPLSFIIPVLVSLQQLRPGHIQLTQQQLHLERCGTVAVWRGHRLDP